MLEPQLLRNERQYFRGHIVLRVEFNIQPGRDAQPTIDGFVFQVNVTILHWLDLTDGEHLELEAGEDIDLVRRETKRDASGIDRTVEQVHKPARAITLRSRKTIQAIANFCGHRSSNPGQVLKFRFLTTAKAGREQGWPSPGIETWEALRQGQLSAEDQLTAIEQIRKLLNVREKPRGVSATAWESFRALVSDPQAETLAALIRDFEWVMGTGDPQAFEADACRRLSEIQPGRSPAVITRTFTHLFAYVFRVLCQKGKKELTAEGLQAELRSPSITEEDLTIAERLLQRMDVIEDRLTVVEDTVQQHLSQDAPRTFLAQTPSAREQGTGLLFDYNQVFRGRRAHLEALDGFLDAPESLIAVVPGRGGIGKTKLLREWSCRKTAWNVLWTSESSPWHPGTDNEIPQADTLLIADDAHRYPDLAQLIDLVATWRGTQKLKLVIATRPSGRDYVNGRLAQSVDESRLLRCATLLELTLDETIEIAKEMLGPDYQHLALPLAEVSKDTPLVTVVGGRLIVRGEIIPDLLANHESFQHAVFDKFAAECAGQLPVGGKSKEELLHLLSALQPIDEREPAFDAEAQKFLGLRSHEIRQNVLALEETGIVIRSRNAARIVPDVLADYLLERASVGPNHYVTGYADAVFEAFHESYLSNLLKNLAELDWRITQRDPETRLLENVWSRIREVFKARNAQGRRQLLGEMAKIVWFQPEAVHRLLQIAMDDKAETSYEYGFKVTSEQAIRQVPELLSVTIYDEKSSADAFRRLWLLSQSGPEDVRDRARRALKEAIGYKKYKSLSYNERVLSHVESLAADPDAYSGDFTPLDVLDTLLDREISHTEPTGRAFSVTALPVNYNNVNPLRERAIQAISACLESSKARISVRAVDSLSTVLSEFHPGMRMDVTEEEQEWQDGERIRALDLLNVRVEEGSLALPLLWRIHKLLYWVVERSRLTAGVKEAAARLTDKLLLPELFEVFDALCAEEWEYNTVEDGFYSVSDRRSQKEQRAIADLATLKTASEQIATIENLVQEALDAGLKIKGIDPFLTRLCRDRAFLQRLSEHLLTNPKSILAKVAGIPVRIWREVDPVEFSHYGCRLAEEDGWRTAASVAEVVCGGPPLNQPIPQDAEILTVLIGRKEPAVLGIVLGGLARLGRVAQYRETAIRLILRIDIGESDYLGRSLCEIVGPGHMSPSVFDEHTIRGILEKLVKLDELPDQAFGTFLAYVCGRAPLAVVEFLEARLSHAVSIKANEGYSAYKPLPSPSFWSSFQGVRESRTYNASLKQLFGWMRKFPRWVYETIELFWRFATTDETTFSVLDEALHSSAPEDLIDVLNVLSGAPKNLAFNHVAFAIHILNACASNGAELEELAMQRLKTNCLSLPGGIAVGGSPIPIWNGVGERAQATLALCEPDSPAFRLYSDLAQVVPSHLPIVAPEFEDDE